ncbi:hypothetical protein [Telmatospirillum sp. J64-1]|uniref:hypothetical protein n=1 Tax=Telmatospirillum sp. J64-1 TaxID=2502183 RepID=UPI00115F6E2B|nr:hypothetical protein [Telmatospirillum sp. J64-1]
MADDDGKRLLDEGYDKLEQDLPDRVTRILRWLRNPKSRWVRLPVGILLIIASFFWFLPILGMELLPIGLLLIAQDVPFLRKPVGKALIWLEKKWRKLHQRWQNRTFLKWGK